MSLDHGAMPVARRAAASVVGDAAAVAGVAEGTVLAHDAGNLLGALSLYSDLLAMPGVLNEEHRENANELRLLSDRSWGDDRPPRESFACRGERRYRGRFRCCRMWWTGATAS